MKHPHKLRPIADRLHGAGIGDDLRADAAGGGPDAAGSEGSRRDGRRRLQPRQVEHRRRRRDAAARHSAVGDGDQQHADAGAGRDEPRRCAAQCAGHHDGRRRRRVDRQQLQPARLHRAHGSLSRRDARPRAVLPRRLLARCGRGAAGPVVDAVRPRVDRRRHQPGEQGAHPHPVRHGDRDRRHAAVVPGHHGRQPADRRRFGVPRRGDGTVRPLDARRHAEPRLRRRAVALLRDGHGDRDHPRRLADAQQRHARLRAAAGQRRARGGRSQDLLRRHRRPDAAGRHQPQRNDHPQGRGERHAAQPDVLLALQDRRAGVRPEQRRHAIAGGRLHGVSGGELEQHHRLAALVAVRRDRQSRPRDHRFIALQPDGRHHRIRRPEGSGIS